MSFGPGLIIANRSYIDHAGPPGVEREILPDGGLLAALRAAAAAWPGMPEVVWIGAGRGQFDREWVDSDGYETVETQSGPLRHRRLFFDGATWAGYYATVANAFLWPLLHLVRLDLPEKTAYYPVPAAPSATQWNAFRNVNRAFAAAAEESGANRAWIHDYQLGLVPRYLRESGFAAPIGFFLHTPFPNIAVAARYLAHEAAGHFREWCEGLLGADLIGFQTVEDVERFCEAVVRLGAVRRLDGVEWQGRTVAVAAHPVGIAPATVPAAVKGSPLANPAIAGAREAGLPLVVGLERADYTKGIPERHSAIALAFQSGRRFAYVGVCAPTRPGVAGYAALNTHIQSSIALASAAAREAAGFFDCRLQTIGLEEVITLLSSADVVFTSSLADGMNLVPLQAVLAQSERGSGLRGAILAGRDAGVSSAYRQFVGDGLLTIEPTDIAGTAAALSRALAGGAGRISDEFVAAVQHHSARHWADRFFDELEATRC